MMNESDAGVVESVVGRSFRSWVAVGVAMVAAVASAQTQNPPGKPGPGRINPPLPSVPSSTFRSAGLPVSSSGWRHGYSPMVLLVRRSPLRFSRYAFDFVAAPGLLLSPFYLYSNLPPFIVDSTVGQPPSDKTPSGPPEPPTDGATPPGDPSEPDSDSAVFSLKHLWESGDASGADGLSPATGEISVSVVDRTFEVPATDFLDLLKDGVSGTKTVKWSVQDEHVEGDRIQVTALHTYVDAGGKDRQVVQTYRLQREGSNWVIREFGSEPYSSPAPPAPTAAPSKEQPSVAP